jgi:hypothetical protein
MLSPWPERRRPNPYGGARPPSVWRLVLMLLAVLAAIYWLLRMAYGRP